MLLLTNIAQDVVGPIHPWSNSTADRVYAREGLAQMVAVIETEGLADAKFQQVWIWNDSHGVVPDTAVKGNVSREGQLQDEG